MRVVLVLFALFAFSQIKAQTEDSTTTEILMVNFYLPTTSQEVRGVYFFYPNDSLVIQQVAPWTKEQKDEGKPWLVNLQVKSKIFDDLYKQGWRLILYNSDDNTYLFERTIQT